MSYDTSNDDILDLLGINDPILLTPLNGLFPAVGECGNQNAGYVHPDERTCAHCVRNNSCWNFNQAERVPINFSFRSGWDANRFGRHMWGVVGQICGRFEHSNSSINARHERAERRRRDENGEGNEWDTEVN